VKANFPGWALKLYCIPEHLVEDRHSPILLLPGTWLRERNADSEEKTSLVEKLFQFETGQSYIVHVPNKADIASLAQVAHLLSEPTLAEDTVTSTESSVEYHCNSCSVDCSRKRYHGKALVRVFCFITPARVAALPFYL
jgi:hypothetical protein